MEGKDLRKAGLKVTLPRLKILEILERSATRHLSAEEIYKSLIGSSEDIGLATVYRTLSLLHEHGAVDTFSHHAGELCYRLCGDVHHHHLVCTSCHRVVELADCDLEPWVKRSAKRHGFTATAHEVEIRGVCAACRG